MASRTVAWKCPRCGATYDDHGKGGYERCQYTEGRSGSCNGFLCECEGDGGATHGKYAAPCLTANCYHCGWGGTFPPPPKKALPWEKKALAAGWTPPKGWRK